MNRTRKLFVLAAMAALTACAPPPPPGGPSPGDDPSLALLSACPAGSATRMECLESALLRTLHSDGIAAAMSTLERIGDVDAEVRRDGHVYAHVIGLAAYSTPDQVGAAFGECTPAFQSGCYHGVIQSYFVDVGRGGTASLDAEQVNALCADYRSSEGVWLLFQCAHGMGHGLTMLSDYRLPQALEACDMVASPWERDACYGGVFMENIVNATAPHHTTGRPDRGAHGGHAEAGEHAHHSPDEHAAHGAGPPAEEFPPLDPADPHYPCSALDERYRASCYVMQTSVVLHFTGGDFRAAARMCEDAPDAHRSSCFRSLGRDASSYAVQNHEEGLRLCSTAGAEDRSWCHVGYVKNVIDVTARPEDGIAFCRMVPAGEAKERCYRAVGEQIWLLASEPEHRAAFCASAEEAYRAACHAGAELTPSTRSVPTR